MSDDAKTATELDVLAARAGLEIQPDRRAAILAGYTELRQMAERLRAVDIDPAEEPANVYGFDPVLRSA